MNSLGDSSKWPSNDSLPSTSSFLLSESEPTEDEAEVFSEGEVDSGMRKSASVDEEIPLSGNYRNYSPHPDQLRSRPKCGNSLNWRNKTKHLDVASCPEAATLSSSITPGDMAFAQKCADLHRFIHPLLELLHGLKTGRFDRGLTSFQQSVAIDRLQRILGIIQKPEMGEKYLQNLLQIERLLKMWFPQLAFTSTETTNQTTAPTLLPHWRQNQLHIPVKKRKLSWSGPTHAGKDSTKRMHHQHGKPVGSHAATSLDSISTCVPESPKKQKMAEVRSCNGAWEGCTAGHKISDRTGTSSRLSQFCRRKNKCLEQPEISPPSSCSSPATQDCSVSSSNNITTTDSP
ncbi:circadian associated repressor of transcription a isoform 2-T2 [Pholidichthys leucotaenia]